MHPVFLLSFTIRRHFTGLGEVTAANEIKALVPVYKQGTYCYFTDNNGAPPVTLWTTEPSE